MTTDDLMAHALAKPGAWRDTPWDHHPVAKVADKIFCFVGEAELGVKAGDDRIEADEWLHEFPDDAFVMSYIGRHGWNTLLVGGAIPPEALRAAIDESYVRVVERLPKSRRPAGWDDATGG